MFYAFSDLNTSSTPFDTHWQTGCFKCRNTKRCDQALRMMVGDNSDHFKFNDLSSTWSQKGLFSSRP